MDYVHGGQFPQADYVRGGGGGDKICGGTESAPTPRHCTRLNANLDRRSISLFHDASRGFQLFMSAIFGHGMAQLNSKGKRTYMYQHSHSLETRT